MILSRSQMMDVFGMAFVKRRALEVSRFTAVIMEPPKN